MERIAQFEKVSRARYERDYYDTFGKDPAGLYDTIILPRRATAGSAGYDFRTPDRFTLAPGETAKIPTGIRVRIQPGYLLSLYPRSGLGFKYGLRLSNTVGIIDSDYYFADNEGHIFIKIVNDSPEGRTLTVEAGEAFAQGVFTAFFLTEDDDADGVRTGGFGSTGK